MIQARISLLQRSSFEEVAALAEAQGEDVRARIQTVEPLDAAAEKLQKILRVFVRSDQPIEGVHWKKGPLFGLPTSASTLDSNGSFQTPRTARVSRRPSMSTSWPPASVRRRACGRALARVWVA